PPCLWRLLPSGGTSTKLTGFEHLWNEVSGCRENCTPAVASMPGACTACRSCVGTGTSRDVLAERRLPLSGGARHIGRLLPLYEDADTVPREKAGKKFTYTGRPLPDFYLKNTCKFAV